ncbi:MAG: hypothetical protein WCC47_03170 [Pseudonocardiaceae bacterium]
MLTRGVEVDLAHVARCSAWRCLSSGGAVPGLVDAAAAGAFCIPVAVLARRAPVP